MSCCKKTEEEERTKEIDGTLQKDAKALSSTVKILLLGAGQTGKTTFLKQIQHLYADGFDKDKIKLYRRIIYANVLDNTDALLNDMIQKGECQEDVEALKPLIDSAERGTDFFDRDVGEALMKFWKKSNVQAFYKNNWLQNESCRHYLDRLGTIIKPTYEPTADDIFRCRVKTTGIYELKFQHTDSKNKNKITYILTDVGGQRSERNKWIHCFENVMAVIFFVDLSGFNLVLDEAPTHNRMDESLQLFDAICNSQWFKNTYMILFLNKTDLFKEKLQTVKFVDHMPGYIGDNSYESTRDYIKQKFVSLNKLNPIKPVYVHFTCATDSKNMKFVFNTVTDVVIRNSLKASGLM